MEHTTRIEFLASIDNDEYITKVYNEVISEMMSITLSLIKSRYLRFKQELTPLPNHIVNIDLYEVFCNARRTIEACEVKRDKILGSEQAYIEVLNNLTKLGYLVYHNNGCDQCVISLNTVSDYTLEKYYELSASYEYNRNYNIDVSCKRRWYHTCVGMYSEIPFDQDILKYKITIDDIDWTVKDLRLYGYTKIIA